MSDDEGKSTNRAATTSNSKMEVDKKNSHCEIEKRRRDEMNQYINDLSTMIPLPPSVGKKPDKLTVLKFAVQHMKALQGLAEPLKETNHRPSLMSDDDLSNLITEAAGGFIIVVECDRGQVLYVTDSVQEILNISQDEMVGFDFYEFVHRKDVTMVKTQLSTTASESKEGKTVSKYSSILKEGIENSGNLCPGAKRSFICRMKKGAIMGTKTSSTKTKGNVMVDETDHVLISYEGYLKSWPPNKEINSRSCLVAVGRILEIDTEQTDYSKVGQIWEFQTRQRADSTFFHVDESFTKIFGYCSDEVYGKSAYSFFHKYDLKILAEVHYKDVNYKRRSRREIICRIRAKDGHYVRAKCTSIAFRNPWTKEVDYIATRNVVISSFSPNMSFSGMPRWTENMDITQTTTSGGSSEQQDEMDESLRNLLLKLENLGYNEAKSQRKRGTGLNTNNSRPGDSPQINIPSDIGRVIAEEAMKVGQQLRISSQSAKCTNVHRRKESQPTVPNDPTSSPRNATALENYREVNQVELTGGIHSTSEQQNIPADGIIMEQLAGFQGAMDVMENPEFNDEEESLSLLMML